MNAAPMYPYKAWMPAPIYWPFRGVRTVLVALCFAGFWTGSFVAAWLWFPLLWLWPGSRVDKMRRSLRSMRRGFWVFHASMRVFRLYHRTSPVQALRPGSSPVVFVANHPTLCDVTSIVSLFPNIVAIARPSFSANPLISRAVRLCGFVPAGIHVLKECEDRLRLGFDVLVFPEGTRSPPEVTIHKFHRGAFELAAHQGPDRALEADLQSARIVEAAPDLEGGGPTALLTIEPFDTIDPATSGLDSRALCAVIEQRYRDVLGYPALAQPIRDVQ
jgi:1-acyl-sn-glycerol-3-phosphate acyltransferase